MQVYRIFNKLNGKSYIGITKWSFKERYPNEKWWKWTTNTHLKISVEKYGLSNFEWEALWDGKVEMSELIALEKMYIKQYNSFIPNGYNLTRGGSSESPSHVKEYRLIDFDGNIYNISNLSSFCRKNKLNYGAMLNMVSGINNSSQGFALDTTDIELISTPKKKEWILENIATGELATVTNGEVCEWAEQMHLSVEKVKCLITGRSKTSQGWKLHNTILNKTYRSGVKYKNIEFFNPQGHKQIIENIYQFCKENNLDRKSFYNLINGKYISYRGWSIISPEKLKHANHVRRGKEIILISKDDKEISIKNISLFCRNNQLNRNSFDALVRGKIKQYRGWRIKK